MSRSGFTVTFSRSSFIVLLWVKNVENVCLLWGEVSQNSHGEGKIQGGDLKGILKISRSIALEVATRGHHQICPSRLGRCQALRGLADPRHGHRLLSFPSPNVPLLPFRYSNSRKRGQAWDDVPRKKAGCKYISFPKATRGTSLVVPWLRLRLPKQEIWVQSLVEELRSHMPQRQKKQNIKQKQ